MKIALAKLISQVFGIGEMVVIYLLLLLNSGLTADEINALWPLTMALELLFPLVLLLYLKLTKKISDWDITNRRQRPVFFSLVVVSYLASLAFVFLLTGSSAYFWVKLCILLIMGLATAITCFWKISVHLSLNTLLVILALWFGGWYFWPLILLLPLVAWSRRVLHKHTLGQILGGILLNCLIIIPLLIWL